MKRNELLNKLNINIPKNARYRVFIDTDYKNEADDPYAVIHFLLSKSIDVVGIGAAHFEGKAKSGHSMLDSYNGIKELLNLMKLEDVPFFRGATKPIFNKTPEENDASNKIIEEAKKGPLYVATLGASTNLACALLKEPSIANNITVIFNGGGPYPNGRAEFNVMQDIKAANIIFESDVTLYQIPQDVYSSIEVSLAELKNRISHLGSIGNYLYKIIEEQNIKDYNPNFLLRSGESWTLGDNSTIGILLMNRYKPNYINIKRKLFDKNGLYSSEINKEVRLYTSIDYRFIIEDLFNKLELIYK